MKELPEAESVLQLGGVRAASYSHSVDLQLAARSSAATLLKYSHRGPTAT